MAETAGDIAAGWYPDPHGGPDMRWWDGAQWTAHMHPAARPDAAAIATTTPQPQQTAEAGQAAAIDEPAPTPAVTAESEVAITVAQTQHLERMASFRGLIGRSFEWALYVPVTIWLVGWALSRAIFIIPLFGWVFGLWGFVGTVAVALAALILSPVLALLMLPVVLFTKRPRLKQDVAAARAKRLDGTFLVFERNYGGTVAAQGHRYDISKDQFAALRPVLLGNNERKEFGLRGTIVHTVASREILAAYDASGAVLFDSASA